MNKKSLIFSSRISLIAASIAVFILSACSSEKQPNRTETLYAYEVDVAAESYSAGMLRYMEAEEYKGNRLITKTYYNNNQTVKGIEKYSYTDKDSLPDASIYYDPDGTVMANYKFTNQDGHQVQRDGYEGESEVLLRQERYQYDTQGRRVKKIIFDSENTIQRSFFFGHDQFGNETEMTVLDAAGKTIAGEEYEIALIDDNNEWIEKWGYVGKEKYPTTFYRQDER